MERVLCLGRLTLFLFGCFAPVVDGRDGIGFFVNDSKLLSSDVLQNYN